MPQMSPMWWTTLFIIFILAYMLYMIIMYFFISYKINKNINSNKNTKTMNWMW